MDDGRYFSGSGQSPPMTAPPSLNRQQRRSHLKRYIRIGRAVGAVCGAVSGIGMMMGFWDTGGTHAAPILGGLAIGAGVTALWEIAMHAAARVREDRGKAALCVGCLAGAVIAASASSWGVASLYSGRAALNEYQQQTAEDQERAERAAWRQSDKQWQVVVVTHDTHLAFEALATAEEKGGLSGSSGRGVIVGVLKATALKFAKLESDMVERYAKIELLHKASLTISLKQHATIGSGDDDAFALYANSLRGNTITEADFDLTPLISDNGLVSFKTIINNPVALEKIEENIDAITARLQKRAREIEADREDLIAPTYKPVSRREATLAYAGSTALAGWLVALSVDLLPAVFVLLVFGFAKDGYIANRESDPPKPDIDPDHGGHPSLDPVHESMRQHELAPQ
jgi:hypothetical protein